MPSTLWLKRLTVRAFRSLVDEQTIDLPQSGMVLVAGQNGDTDGSSGAGKTSLVESLAYALGYGEFTATDLQSWSWLTDESIRVKLELGHALFRDVAIQRGKPTWMEVDGVRHTSAKGVDEKCREVLGLSPELLKALTYRPQKTPGLFLAMTDSEKKTFLTELLGLEEFVSLSETGDASLHGLEKDLEAAKAAYDARLAVVPPEPVEPTLLSTEAASATIISREQEAVEAEKALNELKELDLKLAKLGVDEENAVDDKYRLPFAEAMARVEHLGAVFTSATASAAALAQVKASPPDFADIDKKLSWLEDETKKRRQAHEEKLSVLRSSIQSHQMDLAKLDQAEKDLAKLLKELESLDKNLCPTCERPWEETKARHDVVSSQVADLKVMLSNQPWVKARLAGYQEDLVKLKVVDPIPPKMVEALKALNNAKATATSRWQAQVAAAQSKLALDQAEHKARIAEAKSEADAVKLAWNQEKTRAQAMTPTQNKCRQEMQEASTRLNNLRTSRLAAVQELNRLENENKQATFRYEQARAAYALAMAEVGKTQVKMDVVQGKLDVEQDFKAMLKGFLALIFDETLVRISDLTNARLARIPNVAGLTMSFESERETQKGTFKQTIHPVVRKDGNVIPLKAGTSGGMYTAVELAVDLSLADVIAERTGSHPGWLILDEAFEGLDTVNKSACFEMLKEASVDRLVLVIDHTSEMKEMFSQIITVQYENGKSSLVSSC